MAARKFRILKILFLGLVLLIAALVVVILMQPGEFLVQRSTTIAAPASVVFPQVNDLHNWDKWSPWAKLDPNVKMTYEGPAAGTGAVCTWAGNKEVGEGKMTIIESKPGELVRIKLEFFKPFESTSTSEFTFKAQGNDQTTVVWTMEGKNNFMAKAFHLVMNIDKMVGGDFEKGLAKMKAVSEAEAK